MWSSLSFFKAHDFDNTEKYLFTFFSWNSFRSVSIVYSTTQSQLQDRSFPHSALVFIWHRFFINYQWYKLLILINLIIYEDNQISICDMNVVISYHSTVCTTIRLLLPFTTILIHLCTFDKPIGLFDFDESVYWTTHDHFSMGLFGFSVIALKQEDIFKW